MELAVIGRGDFTLGFRLAGIRKTYEVTEETIDSMVHQVLNDTDIGILVMHNDDISLLPETLQSELDESIEPTVVLVGGGETTQLREKIKKAVGVDLWK
ncbi:MAG TPA: V-type ATP synthase subunit F [Methanosarcinales archaeon]|nr:V-type ATP synthase subunit F [Methanosarcinales archaeon]